MSDKMLWGLWYAKEQGQPGGGRWYLDYFGRPCFSYDRRLVAAHAEARSARDGAVGRFSVRAVDCDGCSIHPFEPCECPACDLSRKVAQLVAEQEDALIRGTGEGVPTGILNLDEDETLFGVPVVEHECDTPAECSFCTLSRKVEQAVEDSEFLVGDTRYEPSPRGIWPETTAVDDDDGSGLANHELYTRRVA